MSEALKRMIHENIQGVFVTCKEEWPFKDLSSFILSLLTKVPQVDDLHVPLAPPTL